MMGIGDHTHSHTCTFPPASPLARSLALQLGPETTPLHTSTVQFNIPDRCVPASPYPDVPWSARGRGRPVLVFGGVGKRSATVDLKMGGGRRTKSERSIHARPIHTHAPSGTPPVHLTCRGTNEEATHACAVVAASASPSATIAQRWGPPCCDAAAGACRARLADEEGDAGVAGVAASADAAAEECVGTRCIRMVPVGNGLGAERRGEFDWLGTQQLGHGRRQGSIRSIFLRERCFSILIADDER